MTKKNGMHWGTSILKNKLQKISFKISFACKNSFWEKGCVFLFQNNPFGS